MTGMRATALIDTGCTTTLLSPKLTRGCGGSRTTIRTVDGTEVKCRGTRQIEIELGGERLTTKAIIMERLINDIDIIIGMDVICRLGGLTVKNGQVKFGETYCAVAAEEKNCCEIEDKDFKAVFDGKKWTVEWRWKGEPPLLENKVEYYKTPLEERERVEYEKEVERWIAEGILLPWRGEVKGVLPLMAVVQATKGKVRPVLDFRELNKYIKSYTGSDIIDVCDEKMRKWRQLAGGTAIVDLKSAYLQLYVAKRLWRYQLVRYKGRIYCLTRLGFGLNVAPKIMAAVLKTVLMKGDKTRGATDSYIDDILIDVTKVSTKEVVDHLNEFGLTTKPPEPLEDGAALGLKLKEGKKGELVFGRGNEIPQITADMSRRELFSISGKLLGHYPIARWLRPACSYVKRRASGINWDDRVDEGTVSVIQEILAEVKRNDPVTGTWHIPKTKTGVVWCDASSIAIGTVVEINGLVAEDAAWLRKKDDFNHINVAELEAVLKGVNLALKWGLREMEVRTDSATVLSWINSTVEESGRIRTKGAGEMIIKRRLGILRQLIDEFELQIKAVFVPSEKNKADALTRVNKNWLIKEENEFPTCCLGINKLQELHGMHHMGVDRTLYLVRKVDPLIKREEVQRVVRECTRCQSIDPAPTVHDPGEIGVTTNWTRLAIDITHYRGHAYLSMMDCGPGRLAIWRELRAESAAVVAEELEKVFFERGPVVEVIMDNGTVFHSDILKALFEKWNIRRYYRAAYRPEGNGIVERNHRTVKAIAERGGITPIEATFWYNMAPKVGQREETVPQRSIFLYEWRHPKNKLPDVDEGPPRIQIGEEVWVKPPNVRCTTQWGRGIVTGSQSPNNLIVNGTPRHILDLRRVIPANDEDMEDEHQSETNEPLPTQRLQRERNAPMWTRDYVM